MQANSQHPGQWQKLHGNEDPSGNWTSNKTDCYQKCLPPHPASLPYPEQSSTGNYLAQFSCTILQTPSDQNETGTTQSTNKMKPAQENHFNSKYAMPTEKQNPNIVLWTMPGSNVQIFVPVNKMSLQETVNVASNNNGPNISPCALRPDAEAFNYNNMAYMQPQTTSMSAGPKISQQFSTKNSINNKHLTDTQRDLSPCISQHRQNHATATSNLPKGTSKKRMLLTSDTNHCPPTKNASKGGITTKKSKITKKTTIHQKSSIESLSTLANQKALFTCKQGLQQDNTAKKAVAVVTPLSPIEIASSNLLNKSAYALDARSVQMTPLNQPNFPHPLGIGANVKANGELSHPTSKRQRTMSEPRKDYDAVGAKSNHKSSPKLNGAELNNSAHIQGDYSEEIPDDIHALTDKKTDTGEMDRYSTIPIIEWPLDKLHQLIHFIQQIEEGHPRNKTDAGKEILKLYWNGDFRKFHDAVQSNIYQNVMEEVYSCCQSNDDVILGQIKNDARNQVEKDFHVLKHNEVPPKMEYKSSWLNLNEKLDDIDKECGYSWYFKSFHSISKERIEHEENPTHTLQHKTQDAFDKPSLAKHQCSAETVNQVVEVGQTLVKIKEKNLDPDKSLLENMPVFPEQFLPVTDDNRSTKLSVVVSDQTKCQPNITNQNASSETMVGSDCAATDKSDIVSKPSENVDVQRNMKIDQMDTSENNVSPHETFCIISDSMHCLDDDLQKANAALQEIKLYSLNPPQVTDTMSKVEHINREQCEEKATNSAHSIQSTLPDLPFKTGHDRCMTEITNKVPVEVQTFLEVKENSLDDSKSLYENSCKQSTAKTNCTPNPDDVITEQTNCQSNAMKPLTAINLVKTLDNQAVSKRLHKRSHVETKRPPKRDDVVTKRINCQPKTTTNLLKSLKTIDQQVISKRLHERPTAGTSERPKLDGKSPIQTNKSTSASNCTASRDLTVVEQQTRVPIYVNEQSPAKPDNSCLLKHNGMDTEANIANPLVAMASIVSTLEKRCVLLKRQQREGEDLQKDTIGPPEIVHASSWLDSNEQCDNTDKQCDYSSSSRSSYDAPKNSQEQQVMGNFKDKPTYSDHAEQNTSLDAIKLNEPSEEDVLGRDRRSTEAPETSRLDGGVCSGDQRPVLTDESTNQNNLCPPKCNPVVAEQQEQQFVPSQDESSEEIPQCAVTHDNLMCETVLKPGTEAALQVNTEEYEVESLGSIKMNVLPREIAQQWFDGKMGDYQDLQKNHIEVLDDSDDQIKIEVLDLNDDQVKGLFSEVHVKDVKPKERNSVVAVDVELESYCCLAKWFESLNYGDGLWCMCNVKTEMSEQKTNIKDHGTSLKSVFAKDHGCTELKLTSDENSSKCMKTKMLSASHTDMPNDAATDKIKIVKACPVSEEMLKAEKATSEQIRHESPSKCETDKTLKHYKKDNPSPDVKTRSETVCLSLYGSSSNIRGGEIQNKRYKDCCEEPPKTVEITINSHQKNERTSKKRKWVESMDIIDALDTRRKDTRASLKICEQRAASTASEVAKENVHLSALTRKQFNSSHGSKSGACFADKEKQKKRRSSRTQQISMNHYIIRRKTLPSRPLPSPEPVMKSKYELGNPALMPLQGGFGLGFKVLPSSFNFEDGAELNHFQADISLSVKNDISYPEYKKAKRMKTSHSSTQGAWCFSPLRIKHIQSTDVSGSCSLFQEFKKRYQERNVEMASRQNSNSK